MSSKFVAFIALLFCVCFVSSSMGFSQTPMKEQRPLDTMQNVYVKLADIGRVVEPVYGAVFGTLFPTESEVDEELQTAINKVTSTYDVDYMPSRNVSWGGKLLSWIVDYDNMSKHSDYGAAIIQALRDGVITESEYYMLYEDCYMETTAFVGFG